MMDAESTPRLSQSVGWELLDKSPRHAWRKHRLLGAERLDPTRAMDHGTLVHELVLGGDRVVVLDHKDWRTKKAKEDREAARADGQVPILRHQYERAVRTAAAVEEQIATPSHDSGWPGVFIEDGVREGRIEWDEGDVPCEGTPDWRGQAIDKSPLVFDLKYTEGSAAPKAFGRRIEDGLAMQMAAYLSGLSKLHPELAGRWSWWWVVVEGDSDEVAIYHPSSAVEQLGSLQWERAVSGWRRLLELHACSPGEPFPGYGASEIDISTWALAREEEMHP